MTDDLPERMYRASCWAMSNAGDTASCHRHGCGRAGRCMDPDPPADDLDGMAAALNVAGTAQAVLPPPDRWDVDRDGAELRVVLRYADNAESREKVRAATDAIIIATSPKDDDE